MHRLLAACTILLLACHEQDPPAPKKGGATAASKPSPDKWKEVDLPVKMGVQVGCDKLLPTDKLAAALNKPKLVVQDDSAHNKEATSVCHLTVPSGKKDVSDEDVCLVEVFCSSLFTVPEMKKRCEQDGQQTGQDVGDVSCVKEIPASDHSRWDVTFLDGDTRCKVIAKGGIAEFEVAGVMACAKATEQALAKENLPAK